MKIRDDDKRWISDEIARQLEEIADSFKPHGWRKVVHWVREIGPIIGICSFVLALIAIVITLAIFGISGRTDEAAFRGKTEERLNNIEASIHEMKQGLIRQSITVQSTLPTAQFSAALPDIHSSITSAKQQDLKVPTTVVENIAHKLAETDTNIPAFWPTAAAIISYQSTLLVGSSRNWSITFPACPGTVDLLGADKNLTVRPVVNGKPTGSKVHVLRIGYSDCYVVLDGKTVSRWDCTRCLVKYSGGPVSLTDVHFKDCLFIFDFTSRPTVGDGERLIEALLISKSQDVNLRAS